MKRKPLDIQMPHEKLIRAIQRFAQATMNARQVSRRLEKLLPARLKAVEGHFRRESVVRAPAAVALRQALCDPTYLGFMEEYAAIHGDAVAERVQYETHMMLVEARRSLRSRSRICERPVKGL